MAKIRKIGLVRLHHLVPVHLYKFAAILIGLNIVVKTKAQTPNDSFSIYHHIYIDSTVTISAKRTLDVKDILEIVRSDESLYRAFVNLRFAPHEFSSSFEMMNRKGKIRATYHADCKQVVEENCRSMIISEETHTGDFFKKNKKEYKYFTAQLFDKLFYTWGKVCFAEENLTENETSFEKGSGGSKYERELRNLIFAPGTPSKVPLIGSKTAIFDEKMSKFYNYTLRQTALNDEFPDCYLFTVNLTDPENTPDSKTVYKYFSTYLNKKTFQVLAREYHLAYKTLAYKFDIKISIILNYRDGKYYPEKLNYEGEWKIPFKKREEGNFEMTIYNFNKLP